MAVRADRLPDGHKSFIPKRLDCVPLLCSTPFLMPDAYSHKTIKNPGSEKNAECGMRNWESIQFVFLPHSAFRIPHSGNRWLGPRTPSLREGPGSASVPSGSPDPAAATLL